MCDPEYGGVRLLCVKIVIQRTAVPDRCLGCKFVLAYNIGDRIIYIYVQFFSWITMSTVRAGRVECFHGNRLPVLVCEPPLSGVEL